jgi:hypothetical protein
MRREPHVRFCERAAVRFLRATHLRPWRDQSLGSRPLNASGARPTAEGLSSDGRPISLGILSTFRTGTEVAGHGLDATRGRCGCRQPRQRMLSELPPPGRKAVRVRVPWSSNITGSARPARSAGPRVFIHCWCRACFRAALPTVLTQAATGASHAHPSVWKKTQASRNDRYQASAQNNDVSRYGGKGRAGAETIRGQPRGNPAARTVEPRRRGGVTPRRDHASRAEGRASSGVTQ